MSAGSVSIQAAVARSTSKSGAACAPGGTANCTGSCTGAAAEAPSDAAGGPAAAADSENSSARPGRTLPMGVPDESDAAEHTAQGFALT